MSKSTKQNCLIAFLLFSVLIVDQVTKAVVVGRLKLGECVDVFPFFNFVRVQNKGVSFGLLSGALHPIFLVALSVAVICYLIVFCRENERYRVSSSLILGGALGNIIDRLRYGAVIDFLDFHLDKYHWPAFNVADSAIVVGVLTLFFISYWEKKNA